jgi:hypothetical protein
MMSQPSSDSLSLKVSPEEQRYSVSLPCDADSFTTFIAGLLGRPESIRFEISSPFEANRTDLVSLHHLVTRRGPQSKERPARIVLCDY